MRRSIQIFAMLFSIPLPPAGCNPAVNVFIYADNDAGSSFCRHHDWTVRAELVVLQKPLAPRSAVQP